MVHTFFLFIATIISITHDICKEIAFCNQNFQRSTNYFVIFDKYIFNQTHLTLFLQNENNSKQISLTISSPKEIGIRFKTELGNQTTEIKEETIKFDISSEDSIINQTLLQNFQIFALNIVSTEYFQLITSDIMLKIYIAPFIIDIFKSNQNIATFNKNQSFLFESNSGIDISLKDQENYFFSGMGESSQSFNIDQKIYRLYNSYQYSSYSSVPFIIAHSQYHNPVGLFWANPSDTFIRCSKNSIRFLSETGFVDFYIFTGSYEEIYSQYSLLTGKPFFPPLFSLGYHQSRSFYKNQNDVQIVMNKMKAANIPFDSIWLDINHLAYHAPFGYNESTFPELKKIIGQMLKDDRFLIRYSNAHLPMNIKYKQYEEAKLKHYLVKKFDGKSPYISSAITGQTVYPDFLNPGVMKWWSSQYNYNIDVSSTNVFYWIGNNINFPKNVTHYKSFENRDIHNIYGLLMSAATSQGLIDRNIPKTGKSDLRPYLVSLDTFSGSQRYTWSWTGNNNATWNDLKNSLSQVISNSVSGLPFTGSNVGGFNGSPSNELIVRWFQLASWTYPFFRQQNNDNFSSHEPCFYNDQTLLAIKNAIISRYRHLLIWYNAARISNLTGNPIVKPLWLFLKQTDNYPQAHTITDQVIIADTFMVAPIITKNQTTRYVDKPPGRWYCYPGGYEIKESTSFLVSIFDTPIFLVGGKIILVYQDAGPTAIETIHQKNIDMYISLNEKDEAYGDAYLDDGLSFDYRNGSFLSISMNLIKGSLKVTNQGEFGSSENDDEEFINSLKISNIYIFGLKEKPKINDDFVADFNGDRLLIQVPDAQPLYLRNQINLKIIDRNVSSMKITTIVISALLGIVVLTVSIIVPVYLIRREKMKKKKAESVINGEISIQDPILNNESI